MSIIWAMGVCSGKDMETVLSTQFFYKPKNPEKV